MFEVRMEKIFILFPNTGYTVFIIIVLKNLLAVKHFKWWSGPQVCQLTFLPQQQCRKSLLSQSVDGFQSTTNITKQIIPLFPCFVWAFFQTNSQFAVDQCLMGCTETLSTAGAEHWEEEDGRVMTGWSFHSSLPPRPSKVTQSLSPFEPLNSTNFCLNLVYFLLIYSLQSFPLFMHYAQLILHLFLFLRISVNLYSSLRNTCLIAVMTAKNAAFSHYAATIFHDKNFMQ